MGLPSEAFWSLTLRQFALLQDRHERAERAADRRAGEIVAIVYNSRVDPKKDPKGWTWLDVFPEHREPAPAQSEDQMYAAMLMWSKATERRA